MASGAVKIGIIGCGSISGTYLRNFKRLDAVECVAVADVRPEAAQARATEYSIQKACSPGELLSDPDIEVVVNLTPHGAHAQVATQALEVGKNVYNEKPFTVYREDAEQLLALAAQKGLRVGGAPDTFLGGAWQTARRAIDDGVIGEPIAVLACLHARGPARHRPRSAHSSYLTDYFEWGFGPAFDRSPYYLQALINLLGPIKRVMGLTRKTWEERERYGRMYKVNLPTHVSGLFDFASGVAGQFLLSLDLYSTGLPNIEVYGTEGALRCGEPDFFGGSVYLRKPFSDELVEMECKHGYNENCRGVGVADMAVAIRHGRPHRASGEMGSHVVDIINALHESADEGRRIELRSTCVQPKALPLGLLDWTIDD